MGPEVALAIRLCTRSGTITAFGDNRQMLLSQRPYTLGQVRVGRPGLCRCLPSNRQRTQRMVASATPDHTPMVLALDFDGVVCDSVGESSATAWTASESLWPEIFSKDEVKQKKTKVIQQMEIVRPVVETGYENLVQIRCLVEGVDPNSILEDWHTILPEYMDKWQLDRSQLVDLFGGTRDKMIQTNLDSWLNQNRIYPGVGEALRKAVGEHEVYVVTTKQARFTEALLKDMAKVPFQADRIFSQAESGRPKTEVLAMLQQRHPKAKSLHFVEDKLSTLNKVCKADNLEQWKLYLVDWGYNTEAERKEAQANRRIHVISNSQFSGLLSSGTLD